MKRTEAQKVTLETFRNGPTHAKHEFSVEDVKRNALEVNLLMFGQYLIQTHMENPKTKNSYEDQRMMAKIYTDMILEMLKDFIDSCERGELDG